MMLFLLCVAIPAQAAFEGPNSTADVNSAAQVAGAADNAGCLLEGNIVEKITGSKDKYTFKDATGTVVVEIDDHVFAGRKVTPAMTVRLTGKVDTSKTKPSKVDVKTLEIKP
ncbi:MAG: NirD/YgiW/YdeI family stress tolerance protein [Desulfovibrionaceae bacterium]